MSLKLYDHEWNYAVQRLVGSSKREPEVVLRDELKQVIRLATDITPPGSEGVKASSVQGRKQGENAVMRDIMTVYGTPADAMRGIALKDEAMAKAFWRYQKQGDVINAKKVMERAGINRGFAPFDKGAAHKRLKNKSGRGRARAVVYFITDLAELERYIKERQDIVLWLASGWNKSADQLGLRLPASLRHDAPGSLELVIVDGVSVRIKAINSVKYASEAADMERRLNWVLATRRDVLDRRWNEFVRSEANRAGLKVNR